jgi:hypothetical protein
MARVREEEEPGAAPAKRIGDRARDAVLSLLRACFKLPWRVRDAEAEGEAEGEGAAPYDARPMLDLALVSYLAAFSLLLISFGIAATSLAHAPWALARARDAGNCKPWTIAARSLATCDTPDQLQWISRAGVDATTLSSETAALAAVCIIVALCFSRTDSYAGLAAVVYRAAGEDVWKAWRGVFAWMAMMSSTLLVLAGAYELSLRSALPHSCDSWFQAFSTCVGAPASNPLLVHIAETAYRIKWLLYLRFSLATACMVSVFVLSASHYVSGVSREEEEEGEGREGM